MNQDTLTITNLKAPCTLGIHPWEKARPQMLWIDLTIPLTTPTSDHINQTLDYSIVAEFIRHYCRENKFQLIEILGNSLCLALLENFKITKATLTITKPYALPHSKHISINITRQKP
jgi:FolB domain-containing protein